jgi:hypothetical protein
LAGLAGALQELGVVGGVGGDGGDVPQICRPDQQVGGLTLGAELLGEVGAPQQRGECLRRAPGPFVVGCEVAESSQLVDPRAEHVSRWAAHAACTGVASPGR